VVTYRDDLPVQRWSPIRVLVGSDVAQLRWSRPTPYQLLLSQTVNRKERGQIPARPSIFANLMRSALYPIQRLNWYYRYVFRHQKPIMLVICLRKRLDCRRGQCLPGAKRCRIEAWPTGSRFAPSTSTLADDFELKVIPPVADHCSKFSTDLIIIDQ